MRIQKGGKKSQSVTYNADLSFIDEAVLDQAKVRQLIENVVVLTDNAIDKTLISGENTCLLVSLCKKLEEISQQQIQSCQISYVTSAIEFGNMRQSLDGAQQKGDDLTTYKLGVVLAAVGAKINAYQEYVKVVNVHTSSLKTLTKLLESLLKRQEDYGSELLSNPTHTEYLARAYPLINIQWTNLRKVHVLMQKQSQTIGNIDHWNGTLDTGDKKIKMETILKYRRHLGLESSEVEQLESEA